MNDNQIQQSVSGQVFTFDKIYDDAFSTKGIYDDHLKSMIGQAINGYNVTILAFG